MMRLSLVYCGGYANSFTPRSAI